MEEFVECIERNKTRQKGRARMDKRREFLLRVLSSVGHPNVKVLGSSPCSEDGDIKFEVLTSDIGLSYIEFAEYKSLMFVPFVGNFIGELLVRENIGVFADILSNIDFDEYPSVVSNYKHRVEIFRNRIVLSFHISLLQSILTEDFEKQLKRKLNS